MNRGYYMVSIVLWYMPVILDGALLSLGGIPVSQESFRFKSASTFRKIDGKKQLNNIVNQ